MKLYYNGFCERGMYEGINQDSMGMFCQNEQGLFLVSDGMGGHSEGERASKELLDACHQWWAQNRQRENREILLVVNELKDVLEQASQKIWVETEQNEICGATVALLWVQKKSYALIWSGDSRCYKVERGIWRTRVKQMTLDDVWENQQGLSGGLTAEEIQKHPNRGKLVRAAGVSKNFACTIQTGTWKQTVLVALCTDGVYKYIDAGSLEKNMIKAFRSGNLWRSLREIRNRVYQNQAPDDFSCVMIRFTT